MKTTRHILILLCLMLGITASAQISYQQAEARANRFFSYQEWASASALYNFMLQHRPDVPDTYGRAIVSNAMLNDSIQSMQLLKDAMSYKIPLDTVLAQVRKYSFTIGHGNLYERFMLQAAKENPWLSRPLDHQLLKYYTFRNDGPKMVQYATTLLKGVPDNIQFLSALANGYLLSGDTDKAVDTWLKIVSIDPTQYNALLYIANYYEAKGDTDQARIYFTRAYHLHPTPYVASRIASDN